jgi:hypothetical protein
MPESPDFDQIARRLILLTAAVHRQPIETQLAEIAEQLRLVWNARGAADVIVVAEDHDFVYAIKALDR